VIAQQRVHALDAVRAFALLCGIVLHAAMSFSPAWVTTGTPIVDVSQSPALQGVFHVLHSFRMLLFFVMAGFFANLLLQLRGISGFWRNRLRRIGVPLVAGWIVLMPLLVAPIIWAVYINNGGFTGDGRGMAAMRQAGVPLGHLWFLYYLMLIYAVTVGAVWAARRVGVSARLARIADACANWLVRRHVVTLLMPLPISIALFASADWIPWTGIPSPILGLVPQAAAVVAFGSAFVLGWMLCRRQELLQVWGRCWQVHAVIAIAASGVSLWLLGPADQVDALASVAKRIAYICSYTLGAWSWVVAITGFSIRHLSSFSPVWRYLADASYWMYLAHMPLVLTLQVLMMRWSAHWSIKFPLIVILAFVLLLASYEYLVRGTFVGAWLNGQRHARRKSGTSEPPALAR
jgi:glucans biosynthesis protein C